MNYFFIKIIFVCYFCLFQVLFQVLFFKYNFELSMIFLFKIFVVSLETHRIFRIFRRSIGVPKKILFILQNEDSVSIMHNDEPRLLCVF